MRLNVAMSLSLRANLGCMNEIQPAGKHTYQLNRDHRIYFLTFADTNTNSRWEHHYILRSHYFIEFPMQGHIDADGWHVGFETQVFCIMLCGFEYVHRPSIYIGNSHLGNQTKDDCYIWVTASIDLFCATHCHDIDFSILCWFGSVMCCVFFCYCFIVLYVSIWPHLYTYREPDKGWCTCMSLCTICFHL